MQSPALLLVITGFFLGLTFPFGKLAHTQGLSPIVWAWWVSAGSSIGLVMIRAVTGRSIRLEPRYVQFYFLSCIVALVIPNLLIFSVIPKLGAGFTGLLITLSPVFTLTMSSILSVRVPNRLGLAALAIGFVGAVIVALTRGEVTQPASFGWVFAGLGIPFSLAIGNVYRTMAWPDGAEPLELATGSNIAAALVLLMVVWLHPEASLPGGLLSVSGLAFITVVASTCMFPFFFQLQFVGGPTYLSQIGYVGAMVALFVGTVFLSERYSWITWAGAIVIFLGVSLSARSMKDQDNG
ncbi:MAG: DMT family transporter [Gammaproteobacteria bacterium]|nr:DMT family transporter [Gammaproteobacteria bacterium]